MKRIFFISVYLIFLFVGGIGVNANTYQPYSSVEETIIKLENYEASGLTDYKQVIDELFSIDSLSDFLSPYYYYSINTDLNGASETTRTKIVSAYCDAYNYELVMAKDDGSYEHVACFERFDEAKSLKNQVNHMKFDSGVLVVLNDGMIVMSIEPTLIQFKTTTCGANHNLYNDETQDTYVNACYIDEALLLDETEDAFKIYMSAYDGWVDRHALYDAASSTETWVSIIPSNQIQNVSYYTKESEDLVHYIAQDVRDANAKTALIIGKAPQWMEEGKSYYSYDGIYFYDDWQEISLDGTLAVNSSEPFYNYFQYLPYRSKTNYSYEQLNEYLTYLGYTEKPSQYPASDNESQLVNEGESFVEAQEKFGINGGLEFAMALHESGLGRSKISIEKNNTFGMNATDNNPYGNATIFTSIRNGVFYHAQRYISWGYTDALSDFRYYGPHVGNKSSGMNVKYASDPYWGEKIAGHYYRMDKVLGSKDYNAYQLAIKSTGDVSPVYIDEGEVAYLTSNKQSSIGIRHYPVLVLEQEGNQLKIQSDMPISNHQTVEFDTTYAFSSSVGYVSSNDFVLLNDESIQQPSEVMTYLSLVVGDKVDLSQLLAALNLDWSQIQLENSYPDVVEVSQNNLTATSSGLTTISLAGINGFSFDVRVIVPVEKLTIDRKVKSLKVGENVQLAYTFVPTNATNQNVFWMSSDETVVTVDKNGKLTALAEGEVMISLFSEEDGLMDEFTLKVK